MKRKKVSVYIRSGEIAPAGYYRILQYVNKIEKVDVKVRPLVKKNIYQIYHNIDKYNKSILLIGRIFLFTYMYIRVVNSLIKDLFWKPDTIIISRAIIPRFLPNSVCFLLKKVIKKSQIIWDFDDHILESKEISKKSFDLFCEISTKIIVTHNYLKSIILEEYHSKVLQLPTTDGDMQFLDKNKTHLIRQSLFENEIHLVWVATSGNLPHIEKILPVLDSAAYEFGKTHHKKMVLKVVCNLPLKGEVEHLIIENIKWTRKAAIDAMVESHIGIMPLMNNTFAKGKGGFKLVQYMSIGLPVIASEVGFNLDIIDSNSGFLINDLERQEVWKTCILKTCKTWDVWKSLSIGSSQRWAQNFSYEKNYKIWEELLEINNK